MRNLFKVFCLGSLSLLLCTAANQTFAQAKKKKAPRTLRDSLRDKVLQRDSLIRSFKLTNNASLNNLLGKIEDYTTLYNQTSSDLNKGFDTLDISQRMPTLQKRMALMKTAIDNSGTLGYLITIRDIVDHASEQMAEWEGQLTKYSNQLDKIHSDIADFKRDTVLHSAPEDTTLQDKYIVEVQQLEVKFKKLDSCARKSIIKIGLLQNSVSTLSLLLLDLNDKIDLRIHEFTINAVSNEAGFIWDMHKQKGIADSAYNQTYQLNYRLYKYFFISKNNYWGHAACILILLIFFAWIFNSRRKITRIRGKGAQTVFEQTRFIVSHPYLSALIVAVILAPYLYDHPPQAFGLTMRIIMMGCIGVLIWHKWTKPFFNFWTVLMGLLIIFSTSDLLIVVTHSDRLILLILSAIAIYASAIFVKHPKNNPADYPPYMEVIVRIFIALNAVSILLNIFGRYSLAKIAGCTATIDLCLAMGLYLFVQVLMEALFLQLEAHKSANDQAASSFFDFKILQRKFKDILVKVAVVLWLVSLAKNINVDDYLYDQANDFLNHPYKFTSMAFTFGSVLIFVIVIWISGLVARVISYFYDFASQQQTKLSPQAKKTRSSILLIRLAVFVIGFFVAIAASGIPMDRITIIIGALGVGIGFGLQNIVNNLVSGVILAFEKPVQIGDIIEVGGKSGRITEIGIRSSKIDIGNGSELIVPNGDLISQHVINWTLTNNNRQIELIIGVAYGSDVVKVEDILRAIVNTNDKVMKTPSPAVFLNEFGESSINFKLLFWAADIGQYATLKSGVMSQVYTRFTEEGIEIPHPKRDIQVYFPQGTSPDFKAIGNVPVPGQPTENPPG